jgi:hypothetical protein
VPLLTTRVRAARREESATLGEVIEWRQSRVGNGEEWCIERKAGVKVRREEVHFSTRAHTRAASLGGVGVGHGARDRNQAKVVLRGTLLTRSAE